MLILLNWNSGAHVDLEPRTPSGANQGHEIPGNLPPG